MNTALALQDETAPTTRQFQELKTALMEIDKRIKDVRIDDGRVCIGVSGKVDNDVVASVEAFFEPYGDTFEWIIQDRGYEFDKSESERINLEIKVHNRVDELLQGKDLLSKIHTVNVLWTIGTRINRIFGQNSKNKKIIITLSAKDENGKKIDRDTVDTVDGHMLLRALRREFEIPAEIRDGNHSKLSKQSIQTDPVEENPIDD